MLLWPKKRRQTGKSNTKIDRKIKALHPGKRKSKTGKTYIIPYLKPIQEHFDIHRCN